MKTQGSMKTQVVIVGGGPGGTAASMYLERQGIESVIVEKEAFPRYHIGESMTGEAGFVLRQLGLGDKMMAAKHPIKHGVVVYGTQGRNDWWLPVMQRFEDGTLKDQFTWQVRRSEFDKMMLDEAVARGATLVPGRASKPLVKDDGTVYGVEVRMADGGLINVEADMVLDCSGQASFLATHGVTGPKYLGAYDKQIAIFSQVTDYVRDNGETRDLQPNNTHIFYKSKYHWAWAIPIDDQVVSVGIVTPAQYFLDKKETKPDYLRRELRELNPELSRRCPHLNLVEDAHVIPNYSFQVRKFAGPGYICLGDAHRFIDPIFSFGLYVTMKEAYYASFAVKDYLNGQGRDSNNPFHDYMVFVEKGGDVLEDVLDTFWENPLAFSLFVHSRYRFSMVDVFAGRIYDGLPNDGRDRALSGFRELLKRERSYDQEGLFSVPIGSRFQPERAPLWNSELDSVETTEAWMREH